MWKAKIIGIDKKHRTRTSPAGRKEPQLKFHEHNNFGSRKAKDHCRKGPLYLVQNKWLGSYFEHSKCWVLIRSTSKPISRWAYCITSYYAILTFRVATTRPLAQFYCRQGVTNLNQRQVKIRAKPTNIFVAISFKVFDNESYLWIGKTREVVVLVRIKSGSVRYRDIECYHTSRSCSTDFFSRRCASCHIRW